MDKLTDHLRSSSNLEHVIENGGPSSHSINIRSSMSFHNYTEVPTTMTHPSNLLASHSFYQLPHTTMLNQWQHGSIIPAEHMSHYQQSLHPQQQPTNLCDNHNMPNTNSPSSNSYSYTPHSSDISNLALSLQKKDNKNHEGIFPILDSEYSSCKKEKQTPTNNTEDNSIKVEVTSESHNLSNNTKYQNNDFSIEEKTNNSKPIILKETSKLSATKNYGQI